MPNPSIKNEKLYEDLREQGNSKQKSARIANAAAARGTSAVGRKGGKSGSYDDWTVSGVEEARQGNRHLRILRADQVEADRQDPQLVAQCAKWRAPVR